ncbi:oligosaccharide flippase family protein [Candidatus Dojkabacteria bacterium]|nr:oligosaccharide flippase family protein [Candidatus Dojkabacteria bacterium]
MWNILLKNGKSILLKEQSDILSASAMMMVILIITKVVGMLVKTVAVSQLGAEKYGIFIAANTLPETLSMILLFGSITSVIIPILVTEIQKNGKDSFSNLFSSLVNAGLLAYTIITFVIIIFADNMIPVIIERIAKPVEPFTNEQIVQISSMMQILMIPQLILGISTFLSSALNAYKRFIVPQLAPLFYNLGILFGAIFLIPLLDGSAWGLTWGVFIGAVLHLLVQIPLITHLKIRYKLIIDVANKRLNEVLLIGLPRIMTLAADQIAIFIDRIIAIGLGAAPLGAYYLAVSLVTIPYSLFSGTFSVASLPHLSVAYEEKKLDVFKSIFSKVFNQILFLTVPVTIILLVLRLPLVRLFYGIFGKEFTWTNTLMVSWVVFFFSLGLIPEVLLSFVNRAFYAARDTIRPLVVGIFVVLAGVVTGILFTNYFSHFDYFSLRALTWDPNFFLSKEGGISAIGGLALSSSIVYSLGFLMLLLLLSQRIGGLKIKSFYLPAIQKIVFGVIMGVFMYLLFKMWDGVLDTARTVNVLILTASTIIPGFCIYFWLIYIFKDPEVEVVLKLLKAIKKIVTR